MGSIRFILYGPTFPILVHSDLDLHSILFNLPDKLRTSDFDILESRQLYTEYHNLRVISFKSRLW
jgi:hypothetical protein